MFSDEAAEILMSSFREQEGPLKTECPVRRAAWPLDIVIRFDFRIDWLLADREQSTNSAADRHGPDVTGSRIPARREHTVGEQVPAVVEVVIDE